MFKYNEFLLENLLTELLLESKIQFSRDFLRIMNSIGGKIADELKKLHGTEGEVTQNYIDVNLDNNNMATFIQDARAQRMIADVPVEYQLTSDIHLKYSDFSSESSERSNRLIYERLGMTFEEVNKASSYSTKLKITAETSSRSSGNIYVAYQGIDDETIRGVVRKDRIALRESDVYDRLWTTSRNSMRVGRLARAILRAAKVTHTDSDIEEFVNKYKARINMMNDVFSKFDVVEGDDIIRLYKYENYNLEDGSASLANSCMAEVDESYLYIYRDNPDKVKLVVLYDDEGDLDENGKYISDKIIGRALLWETENGFKYMDRVYYTQDSQNDLFKNYAVRNGWYYRVRNDWDEGTISVSNGTTTKNEVISVKVSNYGYNYYPYLDSLYYISTYNGYLSSSRDEHEADMILNGTGGDDHEHL